LRGAAYFVLHHNTPLDLQLYSALQLQEAVILKLLANKYTQPPPIFERRWYGDAGNAIS
jgi:hypothetical protein